MDFKSICTRSDYVDISDDLYALMENSRWISLVMPAGSGKTTLLSMLYYFFDVDEDSYALFKNAKLSYIWNDWQLYLNHRPVLFLDFSDFHSMNMPSALDYIRVKMLGLYEEKLHLVLNDEEDRDIEIFMEYLTSLEQYDPIGEESLCDHGAIDDGEPHQKSDGRERLEWSLKNLLSQFHKDDYSEENPVLLFDNLFLLEKTAYANDYGQDMYEFLVRFLDFEPDKKCGLYFQANDYKEFKEHGLSTYFCVDPPFHPHRSKMSWRTDKDIFSTKEKLYDAEIRENRIADTEELERMVLQGKVIMLERQKASLKAKEAERQEKMARYRKALKNDFPKLSPNMGIRRLRHLERDEHYDKLNQIVKAFYLKGAHFASFKELYEIMQNINHDRKTDWNESAVEELNDICASLRPDWSIKEQSSKYWSQMRIGDGERYVSFSDIKVYVTCRDSRVRELYIGAIRELIHNGKDGLTAKVSRVVRDETICFYLSRHDFFVLETYLKNKSDMLKKGNPFIAHRGLLGISRDLMDYDSHNAQNAKLLWDYFQTVPDVSEVDLEEMYRLYVLGWNAELSEDNIFRKHFENSTAQTFILMMDTLDVLLGKSEITDDSLLLNGDRKLWSDLTNGVCWGDLGRYL